MASRVRLSRPHTKPPLELPSPNDAPSQPTRLAPRCLVPARPTLARLAPKPTSLRARPAVPAGIFVPSMIVGASLGRLIGELLHKLVQLTDSSSDWRIDPGVYALVGAAGLLGGVTRMTISLTVIVVEVTGEIEMLLPIMFTILAAKLVGDRFTRSLYEIHISLAGVRLLEADQLPSEFHLTPARAAMSKRVVCLREVESLSRIQRTLQTCSHNGFPVVDGGRFTSDKFFVGTVTRARLEAAVLAMSCDAQGTPLAYDGLEEASNGLANAAAVMAVVRQAATKMHQPVRTVGPMSGTVHGSGGPTTTLPGSRGGTVAFRPASKPEQARNGGGGADGPSKSARVPPRHALQRSLTQPSLHLPKKRRTSLMRRLGKERTAAAPAARGVRAPCTDIEAMAAGLVESSVSSESGAASRVEAADRTAGRRATLDLRSFVDRSPYVVHELQPLYRVSRLFQAMGLRRLCVVDSRYNVVGIITRDVRAAHPPHSRASPCGLQPARIDGSSGHTAHDALARPPCRHRPAGGTRGPMCLSPLWSLGARAAMLPWTGHRERASARQPRGWGQYGRAPHARGAPSGRPATAYGYWVPPRGDATDGHFSGGGGSHP